MEEVWKVVPDHPNYKVSNLGRLMSNLSGEWKLRRLKLIQKGKGNETKYFGWNARLEERLPSGFHRTVTLKIHNVVADLFIGPRPPGMLTLHKDDDRANNAADNLYYGTQSQNVKQAIANGKFVPVKGLDGKFRGSKGA